METTTNSIARYEVSMPARGRFGMKKFASRRCRLKFKPNWPLAGMESAQSAIEFEVVRNKHQEDASHAKALEASNEGVRYRPVGAGIRIVDTSSTSEILMTQIQSQQAVYDSLNRLAVQGETIQPSYTASSLRIAPSWWSTTNRCRCEGLRLWRRGLAGIQRENPVPPDSYEYVSTLRRFYAGEVAKTLVKPASNDDFLGNAA